MTSILLHEYVTIWTLKFCFVAITNKTIVIIHVQVFFFFFWPHGLGNLSSPTRDRNIYIYMASLVAQLVKNLPEMQEILVRFLGQEDPLEKG